MTTPSDRDPRRGYVPDSLTALNDLAPRTGARRMEFGWSGEDDTPLEDVRWWVKLYYPRGNVAEVKDIANYDDAFIGIAGRVLTGGKCQGCGKPAVAGVANGDVIEFPANVTFVLDGQPYEYTQDELDKGGVCAWELVGARWMRWCGEEAPAGSTRERLAQALIAIGAHAEFIGAARKGRYDENTSPLALPLVTLVADLYRHGPTAMPLIDQVVNGEFDATPAENEAYRQSAEGRTEHAELVGLLVNDLFKKETP